MPFSHRACCICSVRGFFALAVPRPQSVRLLTRAAVVWGQELGGLATDVPECDFYCRFFSGLRDELSAGCGAGTECQDWVGRCDHGVRLVVSVCMSHRNACGVSLQRRDSAGSGVEQADVVQLAAGCRLVLPGRGAVRPLFELLGPDQQAGVVCSQRRGVHRVRSRPKPLPLHGLPFSSSFALACCLLVVLLFAAGSPTKELARRGLSVC